MNDRIKQLMTESGIKFKPMVIDGEEYEYRHVQFDDWKFEDEADCLENFIHSLIKECCETIERRYKYSNGTPTSFWEMSQDVQDLLKTHFGVQNDL